MLDEEPDLEVAARRMRELQGRWKQVALAPRTQGEAMWRRFKSAQDEIFNRTAAFFAAPEGATRTRSSSGWARPASSTRTLRSS